MPDFPPHFALFRNPLDVSLTFKKEHSSYPALFCSYLCSYIIFPFQALVFKEGEAKNIILEYPPFIYIYIYPSNCLPMVGMPHLLNKWKHNFWGILLQIYYLHSITFYINLSYPCQIIWIGTNNPSYKTLSSWFLFPLFLSASKYNSPLFPFTKSCYYHQTHYGNLSNNSGLKVK